MGEVGTVRLALLDLATAGPGLAPADAIAASVQLAQSAEEWGYSRHWFAEHHNMPSVVSSAPAVLVGHIAAHTRHIRVGSGGVMLPNHAPLVIAEQFGTLATIYPGRIDLGLGRAPGTDGHTLHALRRTPSAAETFPQDVLELQGYLEPPQPGQRVTAVPGAGTRVPLHILGSSLFGASLAAHLGLPYGFASHFAPAELMGAVDLYRREFRPSAQLDRPQVMVGLNVFAAPTVAEAEELHHACVVHFARAISRGTPGAPTDAHDLLASPFGRHARQMLTHSAVGDPDRVRRQMADFAALTDPDELIVVTNTVDTEARLTSYRLVAEIMEPVPAEA